MKIPEEKIQEVREATDIVEVVSQYVTLKKRGKSFVGLCPFHTEKTPSFSVDTARGFYYCFGCSAGGNVFTFVMQMEKVSFVEALRSLATKAGISLPTYREDESRIKETEILYYSNKFASDFFRQCLIQTEAGKKAMDYLSERGFDRKVIDVFQIGYAPDRWDGLLKKAEQASVQPGSLLKAGLIVKRKKGEGFYDRFRGRLMFPVLNPSGRVVGFGGRALQEGEGIPKYINSPETPIYQKSRLLFGLCHSSSGIRREDRVLLVEGYTDLMRFHQCGFDYSVATSGTALTEEQAKLLSRYTKNSTLVFDGDSAGFSAALRGVDVLVEAGLNVEVVDLPKGTDPDSFLRDHGREAMEERLKASQTFIDFRLDRLRKGGKLNNPGDRAAAARMILDTVARMKDPMERNLMIKDMAEKIGVDESILIQQIRKVTRGQEGEWREPKREGGSIREAAEEGLLLLLLENRERWGKAIFKHIETCDFKGRETRLIAESLYEDYLRGVAPEVRTLLDRHSIDQSVVQYLTKLFAEGIDKDVDRFQFGMDCLVSLQQEEIQKQIRDVRERMRSAQAGGEEVSGYSNEWLELRRKLERLKKEIVETWKINVEI